MPAEKPAYDPNLPDGIRSVASRSFDGNDVTVAALEFEAHSGKAWIDLASSRTTLSIVLEQAGGRVETRLNLNAPSRHKQPGMRHISFIPAGASAWGYSDHVRRVRETRLQFNAEDMASLLSEETDAGRLETPLVNFADPRISAIGDILFPECLQPDGRSPLYVESLILALFTDLMRFEKKPAATSAHSPLSPAQLRRVIEYMREHFDATLHLTELANLAGISRSRLGRAFKASTGLSPHRWLTKLRIERAQELLLEGGHSLSDIALATGFSEQSHFTRAFRDAIGATPGEWRRISSSCAADHLEQKPLISLGS